MKIIVSMAASVYKWLFILGLSTFLTSAAPSTWHPFHVSVTEIDHNASDRTLEVSCKIFTDDFENALVANYKTKVDLTNPPNKAAMDSLVKKYLFSHFILRVNGKPVAYNYIGFEVDKEATYGYIEISNVPALSRLDIVNTIMYDKFDDQVNIMHVKYKGDRKSTKLDFPSKETFFSW